MKKNLFTILLATIPFLISCQKEQLQDVTSADDSQAGAPAPSATSRQNCEPFPFAILTLNSGLMTSSSLNVTGNMGFSKNVLSTTNTNLILDGACQLHSNIISVLFGNNYQPTLGFVTGSMVDWKLDESNQYATNLSATYSALTPDYTYGSITYNKTITSNCTATGRPNTVVNVASINLSGEKLTLVGAPSSDDGFIINVMGSSSFTASEIKLTNVRPERVLFNFPNASVVQVKTDSKFNGTILAPTGTVVYLNPDTYEGSIVAKTIYAITYGYGGCGGGNTSTFIQRTYCNGFQW